MLELLQDDMELDTDTDDQNAQLENQLLDENEYNTTHNYHNDDDSTDPCRSGSSGGLQGLTQPTPPRPRAYTHTLNQTHTSRQQEPINPADIKNIISNIPMELYSTFQTLNTQQHNLNKTNAIIDTLTQHRNNCTTPSGLEVNVKCHFRLPSDLNEEWNDVLTNTSNALLNVLVEFHRRNRTSTLGIIQSSQQDIRAHTDISCTLASNIIRATNHIGNKYTRRQLTKKIKHNKHRKLANIKSNNTHTTTHTTTNTKATRTYTPRAATTPILHVPVSTPTTHATPHTPPLRVPLHTPTTNTTPHAPSLRVPLHTSSANTTPYTPALRVPLHTPIAHTTPHTPLLRVPIHTTKSTQNTANNTYQGFLECIHLPSHFKQQHNKDT